jgi:hypothetical protein
LVQDSSGVDPRMDGRGNLHRLARPALIDPWPVVLALEPGGKHRFLQNICRNGGTFSDPRAPPQGDERAGGENHLTSGDLCDIISESMLPLGALARPVIYYCRLRGGSAVLPRGFSWILTFSSP